MRDTSISTLTNADIAELLAAAAESAKQPLQKALRRASRKSFLWPEEATTLIEQGLSLEELPGIGPSLSRIVKRWLESPPEELRSPPEIRRGFQTIVQARAILDHHPEWRNSVKGDLQMHSVWSDGTASIAEMAQAAMEYGHLYIAITDHAKGLKISGGIDEQQLEEQGEEIARINEQTANDKKLFRVLRSIELNLNVAGEGDMELQALAKQDIVLGCFHSALRKKDDQTERYLAAIRNAPWGIVQASSNFGRFSNDILIGNFGDGTINAFDPSTGDFLGTVEDSSGRNIVNPGLWALVFRSDGVGSPDTLYFTAGSNAENHGLFGTISPEN
jgi:hypothetical protein